MLTTNENNSDNINRVKTYVNINKKFMKKK